MQAIEKIKKSDFRRLLMMAMDVAAAIVLIVFLHHTLPDRAASLLLDRGGSLYPFSIQNLMWIVFFIGLGELGLCYSSVKQEYKHLSAGYLPDKEALMPEPEDLMAICRRVKNSGGLFLTRLIERVIWKFQAFGSREQAHEVLNSSLDLFIHEIDLRYNMLRYILWLLPTLGFLGTVLGISDALAFAGLANPESATLLSKVTGKLALAFNTTLLALMLAGVLAFVGHVVQGREERALNMAGQYCQDKLIIRLFEDNGDKERNRNPQQSAGLMSDVNQFSWLQYIQHLRNREEQGLNIAGRCSHENMINWVNEDKKVNSKHLISEVTNEKNFPWNEYIQHLRN